MFWIDRGKISEIAAEREKLAKLRMTDQMELNMLRERIDCLERRDIRESTRACDLYNKIDALLEYLGLEEQEVQAHTKLVKVKK